MWRELIQNATARGAVYPAGELHVIIFFYLILKKLYAVYSCRSHHESGRNPVCEEALSNFCLKFLVFAAELARLQSIHSALLPSFAHLAGALNVKKEIKAK
jgi:hypothetical protein